jgi:hypothetical protein
MDVLVERRSLSLPALEGVTWDGEGLGRYQVQLKELGERVNLKPQNLILREGAAVVVDGVQSQPELNGREGTVLEFDAGRGRYKVRLEGEARMKMLKPECCLIAGLPE